MKPHKRKKNERRESLEDFAEQSREIPSDTDGSYTGKPLYGEEPVQDADDL